MSAGLIDASVVKVDAANDLALLKAVGAFKPLPIAASRTVKLGGTVATVGFPVQDFMRKPGNQEEEFHSWLHGFLINPVAAVRWPHRFAKIRLSQPTDWY